MEPSQASSFLDDLARWLSENAHRFPVALSGPIDREGAKREYRFRDVPSLRVWVAAGIGRGSKKDREEITLEVAAIHGRACVDFFADFGFVIEQTAAGSYYCALCRDTGNAWYTKDRLALLRSHCFEPLLLWCRENIREDRLLVIERDGGFTAAHIFCERELEARWSKLIPGFVVTPLFRDSWLQG